MSAMSQKRSREFLKISGQFKLGALVTESPHPVTANLSEVAGQDIAAALDLLFQADGDVVNKFREFAASGRAKEMAATVLDAIQQGGRIFFTGCGSTGRLSILLDSIWRDFWRQQSTSGKQKSESGNDFENRTFSVMAGGDYALIRSVEGFEDFTAFGKKQISDLKVSAKDVVFAITEGGETSFVIGTAWAAVTAGAKVYFVYNNPDDLLCQHVERSREVIQDGRIEKINLTTGPMSITGSTRMQATSIQLCVLLTVLEMVARELLGGDAAAVPEIFLAGLEQLHATLRSPELRAQLARLAAMEETVYRGGHRNNYFADHLGIDVLTDTTERSPTYCTPPFRKFDDEKAAESWAFLFLPDDWTDNAWENILKRKPRCVGWSEAEISALVEPEQFERVRETVAKISTTELMRYKIGSNGLKYRPLVVGDSAVVVVTEAEKDSRWAFQLKQIETMKIYEVRTGLIYFGERTEGEKQKVKMEASLGPFSATVFVAVPQTGLLLDGLRRVAAKLVLNALSTCTMVRLGRVMGNYMVWVVPSNLKLIDRATRYIAHLTSLNYDVANALLFEVIEYIEPRMKADLAYPPVVGLAVIRAREKCSNEEAERLLQAH